MITQRHNLAIILLSAASFAVPSTVEAGPLLDWLFHRNRSQGLAGTYTAARPQLNGAPAAAARPGCTSCLSNLFRGRSRPGYAAANAPGVNPNAPANAYANAAGTNPYGTTAGYAPQTGGCSSGWCQQTVVRWIPQTAFRTEYQSVPVTTYKTSTTINPANGLPLTCTRPCTSYSRQARRVPYTAYRPIYTTVPVADTWGQQRPPQQPAVGGAPASGYPAAPPIPTYAYQPQSTPPANYLAPGGCTNCQNGGTANSAYGSWANAPGYTPGNATSLPPAAAARPWSNAPLSGPSAAAGATPWRSVDPNSQADDYAASPRATPWQGRGTTGPEQYRSQPSGPTDWRSTNPNGTVTQPPPGQGGTPADIQPSLRPEYPDDISWSPNRSRAPELPESIRRRITGSSSGSFVPREAADRAPTDESTYWRDERNRNDPYAYDRSLNRRALSPPETSDLNRGAEPSLSAPANRRNDLGGNVDAPLQPLRGIRDLDRLKQQKLLDFDDKTAGQRRQTGSKPQIQEMSQTRYAATPIQWAAPSQAASRPGTDWRNNAAQHRTESRRKSSWMPIR